MSSPDELTRRILFGVIAAPIAIAILVYGDWPLAALLAVTAALGAWEFFRIARATGLTPLDNLGTAMAGLANVYQIQGKYAQAEALYSEVIKIRRRLLQRPPGFLLRQGLREDPQAELAVFQPGLKIGH